MKQSKISDNVLRHFDISRDELISLGVEAEVYRLGSDKVLKIYHDNEKEEEIRRLQRFYNSLDAGPSELILPEIIEVLAYGDYVCAIEKRIEGLSLETIMASLTSEEQAKAEHAYLEAACALSKVRFEAVPTSYLPLGDRREWLTKNGTFSDFHTERLTRKLAEVGHLLETVTPGITTKVQDLTFTIRTQTASSVGLVHGDIHPGNILFERNTLKVIGIIDFSSLSMYGDPLLDLAGAIGFYRMYTPERRDLRKQLWSEAVKLVGERKESKLARYLLSVALLTCNLYVGNEDTLKNGHFQWATEILNDVDLWNKAL